ncbi:hypothetical protein Tco_0078622 [Tanacetum coccineum]
MTVSSRTTLRGQKGAGRPHHAHSRRAKRGERILEYHRQNGHTTKTPRRSIQSDKLEGSRFIPITWSKKVSMVEGVDVDTGVGRLVVRTLAKETSLSLLWTKTHDGVPRSITEHKFGKSGQGYFPRSLGFTWLASTTRFMVKKSDGSWRLCVGLYWTLTKACPQDLLSTTGDRLGKGQSPFVIPFKYFGCIQGYHKSSMARRRGKKTAFTQVQGVYFAYTKMHFAKEWGATYQRLGTAKIQYEAKSKNALLVVQSRHVSSDTDRTEGIKLVQSSQQKVTPLVKTIKKCTKEGRSSVGIQKQIEAFTLL